MADERHLKILEKGVEVWNQWRNENPRLRPNLERANLENVNLVHANLNNSTLRIANLRNANLSGANFRTANLEFSHLEFADFSRADLRNANLAHAELKSTNLELTNLGSAILESTDLTNAILISAYLGSADLTNAILISTNLSDANLDRANLDRTNLENADLTNASLRSTNLSDANLTNAIFRGAILEDANLHKVQAFNTNFKGAILTHACIQDWEIDNFTNLLNVKCDYIYLKQGNMERRPQDPHKIFTSREFAKLFQKDSKIVDLIVQEDKDINLFAVVYSLQNTQELNRDTFINIKSIENKNNGDSLFKIEVSEKVNNTKISNDFVSGYKFARNVIDNIHQARLEDKDKIINKLIDKLLERTSEDKNKIIHIGDYIEQNGNFGIGHNYKSDILGDTKITGQIDEAEQPNSYRED